MGHDVLSVCGRCGLRAGKGEGMEEARSGPRGGESPRIRGAAGLGGAPDSGVSRLEVPLHVRVLRASLRPPDVWERTSD